MNEKKKTAIEIIEEIILDLEENKEIGLKLQELREIGRPKLAEYITDASKYFQMTSDYFQDAAMQNRGLNSVCRMLKNGMLRQSEDLTIEADDEEMNINQNWFCKVCLNFFDIPGLKFYQVPTRNLSCPYCHAENCYHGQDAIEAKKAGSSGEDILKLIMAQRQPDETIREYKARLKKDNPSL